MTDLSDEQCSSLPHADCGPVSGVMTEAMMCPLTGAHEALQQAGRALSDVLAQAPEAAVLQQAATDLQQVAATRQMADVEGAVLLLQTVALALQRLADGTLDCSAAHAQTALDLVLALGDYLRQQAWLSDASATPAQPVRLFPYYRSLQALLGGARIHPADLFFPDLTLAVVIAPAQSPLAPDSLAPDYPAWRQRFEKSLLPFLTDDAPAARLLHAGALRDVVAQVAQAQVDSSAHTFWCALLGFAELVADGRLESGLYVKQLFGLINLQMRRLCHGRSELPGAMLRDALFFIAQHAPLEEQDAASKRASLLQQLSCGYGLAGMVPPDFERRPDAGPDSVDADPVQDIDVTAATASSNVIDFPLLPAAGAAPGEPMQQIGKLVVSLSAHRCYLAGTDSLLRVLAQDVSEWRHERQRAASGAALLAARTLAETSGAIGFQSMRQLMLALDTALRGARVRVAPAQALSPAQYDLLERVLQCGTEMLLDFALGELPAGQGELLVALQQMRTQLQSQQQLSQLAPPRDEKAQCMSAHDKLVQDELAYDKLAHDKLAHDKLAQVKPSPALRTGARVALVRVRADILDRIATHAGAVSTSRLKLEGGVVTLRTALLDFSDNLGRLQRQLRDVEMQAEEQIASRMAIGKGGQFDALEFDRCARLQELTRIMAESVSDVAGVHRSLTQGVEIASRDLQQQAGLTLAMQGELERVRERVRPLPAGGATRAERAVRVPRGARQALPGLGA